MGDICIKKYSVLYLILFLIICNSCSARLPNDFDVDDAKSAVANYYLHHFVMIDEDADITYVGYDKVNDRAKFFVSDSVKQIMGDMDLNVGTFYVTKSDDGYYLAINEDDTDIKRGVYYYKTAEKQNNPKKQSVNVYSHW